MRDARKLATVRSYIDVSADVRICDELDSFLLEQVDASLDLLLVKLHVRNAVHQQPPDSVLTLVHGDLVPHLVQAVGGCEPRGTTSDHGD